MSEERENVTKFCIWRVTETQKSPLPHLVFCMMIGKPDRTVPILRFTPILLSFPADFAM